MKVFKEPRLFNYLGNKSRLINYLPKPSDSTKRIVELFGGSFTFSLAYNQYPSLVYETDTRIYDIFCWLKTKPINRLLEINDYINDLLREKYKTKQNQTIDIRQLPSLSDVEKLYVTLQRCGIPNGQFGNPRMYCTNKNKSRMLNVKNTIYSLNLIDQIEMINSSNADYIPQEGDFIFVDPPYVKTTILYKSSKNPLAKYNPQTTIDFIEKYKHTNEILLTYGTEAKEIFPDYDWKLAKEINANHIDGSKIRREQYVHFNLIAKEG